MSSGRCADQPVGAPAQVGDADPATLALWFTYHPWTDHPATVSGVVPAASRPWREVSRRGGRGCGRSCRPPRNSDQRSRRRCTSVSTPRRERGYSAAEEADWPRSTLGSATVRAPIRASALPAAPERACSRCSAMGRYGAATSWHRPWETCTKGGYRTAPPAPERAGPPPPRCSGCPNQVCDCHIGYVHMRELPLYELFGDGVLERIPCQAPAPRRPPLDGQVCTSG